MTKPTTTHEPSPAGRTVHVRIGTFRRAYHPNVTCSALNGKRETYQGRESMTEGQAQDLGLTHCGQCPPVLPQPIEAEMTGRRLYDVPYDYQQTPRVFTVSVAGPGRHDGELPERFVVEAYKTEQAWAKVLSWYFVEHETVDAYVVAGDSYEGTPARGERPYSHDLRGEYARQEALDDLADQAAELVQQFHDESAGLADQSTELETALADAALTAWPLVLEVATNDGRD